MIDHDYENHEGHAPEPECEPDDSYGEAMAEGRVRDKGEARDHVDQMDAEYAAWNREDYYR